MRAVSPAKSWIELLAPSFPRVVQERGRFYFRAGRVRIAGVCNPGRNVVGLMPHPERAAEPELGSADGRRVFEALLRALVSA